MKVLGSTLSLAQLQRYLRLSFILWLVWIVVVETAVKSLYISASAAMGQSAIAVVPLLILAGVFWQAKNGVALIFASMIVMLYLGVAVMAMFKGALASGLYGVEALIILVILFFAMWVIERLPKQGAPSI